MKLNILNKNYKYLVILAGSPRGGNTAWDTLEKYVLRHLNADLAICTGKNWLNNQSFLHQMTYDWSFEEPINWEDYYNQNFPNYWEKFFNLGKGTGLLESGIIHFAIKDIIYKNYLSILEDYDFVIYTRFDQLYVTQHPFGMPNMFLIPNGEDYFGLGDRHVLFPAKFSKKFFNILEFCFNNYELLSKLKYLNCETVYKYHLDSFLNENQIIRYKRNLFCVAQKEDKTNWRVPKYRIYFVKNLKLKYPDEFLSSLSNFLLFFKLKKLTVLNLFLIFNFVMLILRQKIGTFKKLFIFNS